mmetsp:Transcript_20469/g.62423  ORF Transcript_20469/g.62423 Transcript_20469/m.62423 type:complete len:242 (+) Transcript_20469:1403-2128(+)
MTTCRHLRSLRRGRWRRIAAGGDSCGDCSQGSGKGSRGRINPGRRQERTHGALLVWTYVRGRCGNPGGAWGLVRSRWGRQTDKNRLDLEGWGGFGNSVRDDGGGGGGRRGGFGQTGGRGAAGHGGGCGAAPWRLDHCRDVVIGGGAVHNVAKVVKPCAEGYAFEYGGRQRQRIHGRAAASLISLGKADLVLRPAHIPQGGQICIVSIVIRGKWRGRLFLGRRGCLRCAGVGRAGWVEARAR